VAFTILFIALLTFPPGTAALANMSNSNPTQYETPTIFDHTLDVELVYKGIAKPTDIEFLGDDDILVLEKNEGTVKRITNGEMLDEPLLDVNVANKIGNDYIYQKMKQVNQTLETERKWITF
jgi:glucose/arabinose dehydrogenase